MNKTIWTCFLILTVPIFVIGCGGGGSSSSGSAGSGTIVIGVTDAKPLLPDGTEEVLITFDEVSVHRPGGGWISLALAETEYTIDLLQFSDGTTTDLVPPVQLVSGKYTQIRIGVTDASIKIEGNYYSVEIPSENLKTDKQFDFEVVGGGAVDLTVDFDLSQSIVVTGPNTYKLKPVLHINYTQEAATIVGRISNSDLTASEATIVVTARDEEYTRVVVEKDTLDPTVFNIYWLVPEEEYFVQIDLDGNQGVFEYEEIVSARDLPASAIFELNGGDNIPSPTP